LLTQLHGWVICYPELSPACLVSTEIVLYIHTILVPGSFLVKITVWSYPADIPVSSPFVALLVIPENNMALLYAFFWRLNFICRRFGTHCLFSLHRQAGMKYD